MILAITFIMGVGVVILGFAGVCLAIIVSGNKVSQKVVNAFLFAVAVVYACQLLGWLR